MIEESITVVLLNYCKSSRRSARLRAEHHGSLKTFPAEQVRDRRDGGNSRANGNDPLEPPREPRSAAWRRRHVDTAQQQMRAQLEHQATAIADGSRKHDETAQILLALSNKLDTLERGPTTDLPREEEAPDPDGFQHAGTATLNQITPR